MRRTKANNKGITLIALIITIIVLVIIAGFSIGMLLNNDGVLNQSQNAKKETDQSQEAEKVQLAVFDASSNTSSANTGELTTDLLKQGIRRQFGAGSEEKLKGIGPWIYEGKYKNYLISKNGNMKPKDKNDTSTIYVASYCTVGKVRSDFLILSTNIDYEWKGTDVKGNQITLSPVDAWYFGEADSSEIVKESVQTFYKVNKGYDTGGTAPDHWYTEDGKNTVTLAFNGKMIIPSDYFLYIEQIGAERIIGKENISVKLASNFSGLSDYLYDLIEEKNGDATWLDTSEVRDFSHFFDRTIKIDSGDAIGYSDRGCFVTSLDLSKFDTSNAVNLSEMFHGCENITTLDLTSFDTSNVEICRDMFLECNNLQTVRVKRGLWTLTEEETGCPVVFTYVD